MKDETPTGESDMQELTTPELKEALEELPSLIGRVEAAEVGRFSQIVDETNTRIEQLKEEGYVGDKALVPLDRAIGALMGARDQVVLRSQGLGQIKRIANTIQKEIIDPVRELISEMTEQITELSNENQRLHGRGKDVAKVSIGATVLMGILATLVAFPLTGILQAFGFGSEAPPPEPPAPPKEAPNEDREARDILNRLGVPKEDMLLREVTDLLVEAMLNSDTERVRKQEQDLILYRQNRADFLMAEANVDSLSRFLFYYAAASFYLANWDMVENACSFLFREDRYGLERAGYGLPLGILLGEYQRLQGKATASEQTYSALKETAFPLSSESLDDVPLPYITSDGYSFRLEKPKKFFRQQIRRMDFSARMKRSVVVGIYTARGEEQLRLQAIENNLRGHVRKVLPLEIPPNPRIARWGAPCVYRYKDSTFDREVSDEIRRLLELTEGSVEEQTRYGTKSDDAKEKLSQFSLPNTLIREINADLESGEALSQFLVILN